MDFYWRIYLPGDDWEHEETFTDDDEAVDIDPEERADLAPEIPAPPEIKQVDIYYCELLRITNCTSSNTFFSRNTFTQYWNLMLWILWGFLDPKFYKKIDLVKPDFSLIT